MSETLARDRLRTPDVYHILNSAGVKSMLKLTIRVELTKSTQRHSVWTLDRGAAPPASSRAADGGRQRPRSGLPSTT
jgi:hypothetical protein